MTISEQLTSDMATSMKAGDAHRTGVVRLLRSALANEKIKLGHELSDDEATKVMQREAKQRRDSIAAYKAAGRDDLAANEEAELEVVSTYLPEAMSPEELAGIVDEVIAQLGAKDMKSMGAVIGAVVSRVGAKAQGGDISTLVRQRLAG